MTPRRGLGTAVALAGACAALLACVDEPRQAPVASKISLWSTRDGPHLRGANIYQRRVYKELDGLALGPSPVGPPYELCDFKALSELGANTVFLSHPGVFSEKPPYVVDPAMVANLDRLVALAKKADLFAIIALRTGPGRSEFTFMRGAVDTWFDVGYLDDTVWVDEAAQAGWAKMWAFVAERYRGAPHVVGYELMVEPNANHAWLGEYDPLAFRDHYSDRSYDWNRLYPRLLEAVRGQDLDVPVLVGPMSYSSILWLPVLAPSDDPFVVHTVHQYAPSAYCHQDRACVACTYPGDCDVDGDGQDDPFDRQSLAGLLSLLPTYAAEHNALVAVTELGVSRWAPGATPFLADELDLLEAFGASYGYWVFPPAWPRPGNPGEFDLFLGEDPRSTDPDPASPLLEVMTRHFSLNVRRPSNTRLAPKR